MEESSFDIFSGMSRRHGHFIESVQGLMNARERMWEIADEKAGCYFIYSNSHRSILIKIETFEKKQSAKAKAKKAHA
jgi:hypothetical protein